MWSCHELLGVGDIEYDNFIGLGLGFCFRGKGVYSDDTGGGAFLGYEGVLGALLYFFTILVS